MCDPKSKHFSSIPLIYSNGLNMIEVFVKEVVLCLGNLSKDDILECWIHERWHDLRFGLGDVVFVLTVLFGAWSCAVT